MKAGRCVHFNGHVNACCEAGVNYKELAGEGDAYGTRLPCITKYATAPDVKVCEKRREPTADEIEADERAMKERMDRMGKARKAIVEHLGGPWKKGAPAARGEITCPNCGGQVRFTRSGYNGHVHAACSTDDCCSWME